jgi:hypothetical protein
MNEGQTPIFDELSSRYPHLRKDGQDDPADVAEQSGPVGSPDGGELGAETVFGG